MFGFLKKNKFNIAELPQDILEKINQDFGNENIKVIEVLYKALNKTEYLRNERIIRCIIFLINKDINKLQKTIEIAKFDPRDVMFWAEYTERDLEKNPKRIRDFNKTFEKCELNGKE
jgi:galactose-1-phosphate uridylyltransferase